MENTSSEQETILPPWMAFKDIDMHDMFWRMGLGEDYMTKWARYYYSLSNPKDYEEQFPAPQEWEGFYD